MSERTLIAGLTGSLGAGKTTAEKACKEWGLPTNDADSMAHQLLANDVYLQHRVKEYFYTHYNVDVIKDGKIDRQAIAHIAFSSHEALDFLEDLIHPRVIDMTNEWCRQQKQENVPLAVVVAPLLIESGMNTMVDTVIVITAREETRRERVKLSRGWDDDHFSLRAQRQMPDDEKCSYADYVIDNNGTENEFRQALHAVVQALKE